MPSVMDHGKTISRMKEHDDQMMLKSTSSFKTPRTKEYEVHEEDVPPTSSIKKDKRKLANEQRFQ
jgi:hypothetical protein